MFEPSSAAVALAASALLMTVVWALHLRDRDASIVDPVWAPAIVGTGLVYAVHLGAFPAGQRAVALLVPLAWALRLSVHLHARHAREGEDRRYRRMREKRGADWWWQSLFVVFLLQAVLAWVVALPLMALLTSREPLGILGGLGLLLALFGFVWEAIADGQLAHFKANEDGDGEDRGVMDQGLWRYSRHPNYFGETLVWWGLGIAAWSTGAVWALLGPALLTFLLLRVSGVTLTESDIADRRPAYRAYVERTNAFVPGPPSGGAAGDGTEVST